MSIDVDRGLYEIEANVWGDEWVDLYLETSDAIDIENVDRACLLGLLGQAMPDGYFNLETSEVHTRINPFIVQSSGSGKDEAFNHAKRIAREAGFSFWDADGMEYSAFVGKIDENGDEIPGLARDFDILAWREGVKIFKSANLNRNDGLLTSINGVVDGNPIGRAMANGRVEYTPNCSIIATSYIPNDKDIDIETLLRNGNLSRYYFDYREVSREERKALQRKKIERADNTTPEDRKETIRNVEKLAVSLIALREKLGSAPEFSLQDVDLVRANELVIEMQEKHLNDLPPRAAELAESAMFRYLNHTLRIACLVTALDHMSTDVTDRHVDRALEFVEPAWNSFVTFVSRHVGSSSPDRERNDLKMLAALRESNSMLTQEEVAEAIGVESERSIRNYAATLRKAGLITIDKGGGRGNMTTYRVTRKSEPGN